jgi:hypothetical protein
MMKRMIRKIVAAAAACVVSSAGYCVDGVAVELGRGEDSTTLLRIGLQHRWEKEWSLGRSWRLTGYWDISAGAWDNDDESTADVGLTPVFRFERGRFYIEAAIGLHLVQARISAARSFSTAVQFGDQIGAGFRSGRYDFGAHLQHLSNAGIDRPNPGINFLLVRLQYEL